MGTPIASRELKTAVHFLDGEILLYFEHESERTSETLQRMSDILSQDFLGFLETSDWNYAIDLEALMAAVDAAVTNAQAGGAGDRSVSFSIGGNFATLMPIVVYDGAHMLERSELIRTRSELIRLLQVLDDFAASPAAQAEDVALRAVSFNWLAGTAQGAQLVTGGPGTQPIPFVPGPTPAGRGRPGNWAVIGLPAEDAGAAATGYSVEIAILDTAWGMNKLAAHLGANALAAQPGGTYQRIVDRFSATNVTAPHNGQFNVNDHFRVTLDTTQTAAGTPFMDFLNDHTTGIGIRGHEYRMTDHGLFVASVTGSVLETHHLGAAVDVHLVQVLNDYGVGTLETVLRGLQRVLQERVNPEDREPAEFLVINCSFTLTTYRNAHLEFPHLLPQNNARNLSHYSDDFLSVLYALLEADRLAANASVMLDSVCKALQSTGAFIVAAAGNEHDPATSSARPPARYPAALDGVVGVAALSGLGNTPGSRTVATYSNLADNPTSAGVAVFGGEAAPDYFAHPTNSLVGLYLGDFPDPAHPGDPAHMLPNTSGWARWSGTSFATPIVSATLAALLSQSGAAAYPGGLQGLFGGGTADLEEVLPIEPWP